MRLALDTSTTWSSIALVSGEEVVAADDIDAANPGEVVVARIDELLREADVERTSLTGVVVGVGPGPYTSTRVGVAIARALGFALGIEVVGVCSHDAIAAEFVAALPAESDTRDFIVATDARRREVYWARYDANGNRRSGPAVAKPAELLESFANLVWVGNGLDRYPDLVAANTVTVMPPTHPSARWIEWIAAQEMATGHTVPTSQPELADHESGSQVAFDSDQRLFAPFPLYLRRPDAVPSAQVVMP